MATSVGLITSLYGQSGGKYLQFKIHYLIKDGAFAMETQYCFYRNHGRRKKKHLQVSFASTLVVAGFLNSCLWSGRKTLFYVRIFETPNSGYPACF